MFKFLAFGLGAGAGLQAWRNFPADGPVTGDSLAVVFCFGILAAYVGGRFHGRHKSSAWAAARAEAHASSEAVASSNASQTVQLAVIVPGQGAGSAAGRIPSESAPWLAGSSPVREISSDELEGFDLAELVEHEESPPEAVR